MEDWLLPVIALVTVLVIFLVYWFVIRKPSAPSAGTSCTVGADCSSNVSTKDPNWLSYLWDSSCNCNLVSCQTGFTPVNGVCVANGGPTPTPGYTCKPGTTCAPLGNPDPNAKFYMCTLDGNACVLDWCNDPYVVRNGVCVKPQPPSDLAINGLVNGEKSDQGSGTATSLSQCQGFCQSNPNCKVYDYDTGTNQCVVYEDYKSVRGYGAFGSHYIDRPASDGSHTTYVRPFGSGDPEMGSAKMAWLDAKVINATPYGTCSGSDKCRNLCLSDSACQAAYCNNDVCAFYSNIDFVKNIDKGTYADATFLKIKSTL
jgi:hypothetical protein